MANATTVELDPIAAHTDVSEQLLTEALSELSAEDVDSADMAQPTVQNASETYHALAILSEAASYPNVSSEEGF